MMTLQQKIFVLLLIASIFLPSHITFLALFGFTITFIILGIFNPDYFDDIAKILGVFLILILLVEGAHAITAYAYGIPITGVSVNLLGLGEGAGEMMSGWVELDITAEAIDASPELQSQVSWIAAMGSIILVFVGTLHFIRPSMGEFPAILALIMFIKHQVPLLPNDQSYMISQGWMTPLFAWGIFFIGLIILSLAGFRAYKHRGEVRM